ncbi:MAG: hypothetical protein LBF97_02850 [Elusimicrobiota bacterium]|jgi:hypothetical protein|nr:hypothetical protein [Elusimicrobiota bacterium]
MVKRFYNTKLVDNTNYSQTYKTLQDESGYIYSFTISYSGGSETPFAMGSFKIEVNKFDNQIGQEYVSFIRLDGGTQFEGDPFPLRLIGYKT